MIERDAQQVFSHDGWKKWAGFGVQGMPIPREYGGRNADSITAIAIQTHGARGFLTEFELEREMRDSVGTKL